MSQNRFCFKLLFQPQLLFQQRLQTNSYTSRGAERNTLMPCGMSYTPMFSDVPPPTVHTHGGAQFTAVAVDRIAELLETLVTLGQARQTAEGRFVE